MTELLGYQACNWERLRNWRALRSGSNRACSNCESFLRVRLLPNPCRGQRELQQKSFDVVLSFSSPRQNAQKIVCWDMTHKTADRQPDSFSSILYCNRFCLGSRCHFRAGTGRGPGRFWCSFRTGLVPAGQMFWFWFSACGVFIFNFSARRKYINKLDWFKI